MSKVLVEVTPGFVTYLHYDEATDTAALEVSADVEANIDANKRLLNDGTKGYSPSKEWRRIASIPVAVQYEWITKFGTDPLARGNEALLKRLLNDPEWQFLRTSPGRV